MIGARSACAGTKKGGPWLVHREARVSIHAAAVSFHLSPLHFLVAIVAEFGNCLGNSHGNLLLTQCYSLDRESVLKFHYFIF